MSRNTDFVGFYCQLPKATRSKIAREARKHGVPQWAVIEALVNNKPIASVRRPRSGVVNVEL